MKGLEIAYFNTIRNFCFYDFVNHYAIFHSVLNGYIFANTWLSKISSGRNYYSLTFDKSFTTKLNNEEFLIDYYLGKSLVKYYDEEIDDRNYVYILDKNVLVYRFKH